jgi:hypothetical protein
MQNIEDVAIMSKITILFGAGAEGAGQFDLPSGNGFKRDIILAKNVAPFANLFLQSAKSDIELENGTVISANSSSILYQTIVEMQDVDPHVIEKLFPNSADQDTAKRYLQYKRGMDSNENQSISNGFMNLYRDGFYSKIKKAGSKPFNDEVNYFLQHAGIYSFLDSLFNYLRKPGVYKNECARVIKVYYAALLSILTGMSEIIKDDNISASKDYKELLDGKEINEDPKGILSKIINEFQNAIVEKKDSLPTQEKEELYYYNIKELHESGKHEVSCITTNYTSIAEKIIKLPEEQFAYLHGKLNLFEELETKSIVDVSKAKLERTVFPYLLVQSGVKPIISPDQIREFHKACEMIEEAEYLLIIGYGVNLDDEHITNILRKRLSVGKKIKYFIYCNSIRYNIFRTIEKGTQAVVSYS